MPCSLIARPIALLVSLLLTFGGQVLVSMTVAPSLVAQSPSSAKNSKRLDCIAKLHTTFVTRRDSMRPLHDIDLDPARLTLAQIRKLFGGSGDSTTTSLANVRSVGWFVGPAADTEEQAMLECRDRGWVFKVPTVSANFLADTDSLDENSQPIEIEARSPFPGSLRGIRLGQPESLIIELGLKHGYALEPENQIQLDHSWKAYWRSSSDGRLTFVRLRNTRWY